MSTSFILGSIAFSAPAPATDAVNDVNIGYFNLPGAIDDAFNNAGASISGTTVFSGGKVNVIPEPASIGLLGIGAVLFASRRRQRVVRE